MRRALRALSHQPEIAVAGLGSVLIALLWGMALVTGEIGGSGEGGALRLALLSAAVAAVAALAGVVVSARAAEPGLPAPLSDLPEPLAVTRRGGRVIAVNPAMEALCGRAGGRIEDLVMGAVETDARMIYRLSRGAERVGFAFEEVRHRAGEAIGFLVVRKIGNERLAWSLVAPNDLALAMPAAISGRYESAPFCHAEIDDTAVIATNLRFRATFGNDAAGVLEPLMGPEGPKAGRFLMQVAGGEYRLTRVFVSPRAGGGVTDLFLFPLDRSEMARRGPGVGLERVPVALVQIALDGRVLWLNGAAQRLLGEAAVAGAELAALVELRGRPLASLIDEALIGAAEGQPEMATTPGGGASVQIRLVRVELDGEETLLAVLSDASELRLLEDKFAQSQKMEAVGKLAGGVAHDFNNLLTAINGHCDLLLLGRDASQPDYADLNQIKQNANRAAALVRQLLAFSRKQTLNPSLVSITDVVSDTLYLLVRLIGDRVKLELDHARQGELGLVRADRQQIEQALMNLVVNARDAMAEGGTVTISTRQRCFEVDETWQGATIPRGRYVELAVADQGTGIDETIIGKVFDPFFTTKPLGEGTGLGLSTVYGIVKQSGGYIFAENRPEGGACFRILLPEADAAAAAGAAPEEPEAKPDLTGQAAVLLVEDEASVRSVATRALSLRGYAVTSVESAREALEIVARPDAAIDLVISDVMMPGMDGPAFAVEARRIRPGLRVLFISGYAEEAFRRNMEDPDYAFLAKPFSIAELTAKVKEVLG